MYNINKKNKNREKERMKKKKRKYEKDREEGKEKGGGDENILIISTLELGGSLIVYPDLFHEKGILFHIWWTCPKAICFWTQVYTMI